MDAKLQTYCDFMNIVWTSWEPWEAKGHEDYAVSQELRAAYSAEDYDWLSDWKSRGRPVSCNCFPDQECEKCADA